MMTELGCMRSEPARRKMTPVLIAQITDTHITRTGPQSRYLIETVDWINAMRPRPDAVLLTGDSANAGRAEEYVLLRDILARCAVPVYVVPGNHDRRGPLRENLPAHHFPGTSGERINFQIESFPVRLIGLDTTMPNRPGGVLTDADLAWFETALATAPARPTLVFLHHPPFRTGVTMADVLGFIGVGRLPTILARHPEVSRIIAGHIHCERRTTIAHALATTSRSTAPQRVPELFERRIIGLRREPPGFSVHAWSSGTFSTTSYVNAGGGRFVEHAGTSSNISQERRYRRTSSTDPHES